MSEVIDKIVQAQQAEMDEEVANDQVRRLTGQILEDLVGPIHLASKVVLQKLGSTARWLDHAVDTELERRVEIRSDYLEKDEDEEPDGFLSAIRAEMTRRGKATELRNGQLWTKQDGPQLDRLEDMCDVHRQGEVLWGIAERLTGLGLEVGLLPDEEDARNGTIMLGFHRRGDWFTCLLYGDDAIEAAVSTKTPEPYNAFLGAHEGDWTGARKEDPTKTRWPMARPWCGSGCLLLIRLLRIWSLGSLRLGTNGTRHRKSDQGEPADGRARSAGSLRDLQGQEDDQVPRACDPRAWTPRACCQFVYDGLKDELLLIC